MEEINCKKMKEIIKENEKVLVDCYADWCGPCKMLSPILEELSKEVDDIKFYKIDVDADDDISMEYGINAIPNLLYFVDGNLKEQIIGLKSKSELLDILRK